MSAALPDSQIMDDRGPPMQSLMVAMLVFPTIAVILRFWSRALLPESSTSGFSARFWWDDWTCLLAAMINIAVCGVGLKLIPLGLGRHIEVVPPENLGLFLKLLWVEYFIFDTGTSVAKASALLFYARVFGRVTSRFQYALWTVHALNAAWLIGILLAVVFECSPIEKAWKPHLPGTCSNTRTLWFASGLPSLVIDIMILLMPLPLLWKLQMKPLRKYLIMGVFVCGYLVVVVSIGRLVTIVQAGAELDNDPTWNIVTPVFWLASEIPISVISVCLPSIFFFARHAYHQGWRAMISPRSYQSPSRLSDTDHERHGLRSVDTADLKDDIALVPTSSSMGPQVIPGSVQYPKAGQIHVRQDFMVI